MKYVHACEGACDCGGGGGSGGGMRGRGHSTTDEERKNQ